MYRKTSRDRPKSAPYPRLKNSKKTSKCQVLFYSTRNSKFFERIFFRKNYILKKIDRVARRGSLVRAPGALKSHNAKKLKGGTLWDFLTSILSQNIKKMQGGPFGEKIFFRKKSLAVPKKMKGGSLWSRPVWYVTRKNRKNLFGSVR